MSVDIIPPFSSPPLKRARETISLATAITSKCGEVFVTGIGDRWTFSCAYCEKATNDIGNFICHIRLDHLDEQLELAPQLLEQSQPPIETEMKVSATIASSIQSEPNFMVSLPTTQVAGVFHSEEQQSPQQSKIFKEETISNNSENLETIVSKFVDLSSLTQPECNETGSLDVKDSTNSSNKIQDEFFVITSTDNPGEETIINKNTDSLLDSDIEYISSGSSTISYHPTSNEENDDENSDASCDVGTVRRTNTRKRAALASEGLLQHKCPYCNLAFTTKQSAMLHIYSHNKDYHQKLPYKCEKCHRGFHTASGLRIHSKRHHESAMLSCEVCGSTHSESYFIQHVMSHESDTCFPCQVCGKIYDSHEERWYHWQGHSKEKPFDCKICFRRYRKEHYLRVHLRAHNHYQCSFCPTKFNTDKTQRPPYVCPKCINLPDIKERAKQQRRMMNNSHVFDSDEEEFEDETNDKHIEQTITVSSNSINQQVVNDAEDVTNDIDSDLEFVDETHNVDANDDIPSGSAANKAAESDVKYHTNTNAYKKCPICAITITREKDFVKHVMLHESDNYFPCQICAKVFPTNEERVAHRVNHIKERPFGCRHCCRRFFQKSNLVCHMKTHRFYSCHLCHENFETPHTLIPPYVCVKCGTKKRR